MGEDSSPVDREMVTVFSRAVRSTAMPLTSARVLASFALKRVYLNSCNFPESMIVVQFGSANCLLGRWHGSCRCSLELMSTVDTGGTVYVPMVVFILDL